MAAFQLDVTRPEERNRLTVAFRPILAIPHLVVAQVWGYLAQILAVVQWFIILFTGQRNEGIRTMQLSWLEYSSRVQSYLALLHDQFPPFGTEVGSVPVRTSLGDDGPPNRLTNGLRFLWVIPAAIIAAVLGFAAFVVAVVSWFAILFTGRQPEGMWTFVQRALRYVLRTQSYGLMMTDTYPALD